MASLPEWTGSWTVKRAQLIATVRAFFIERGYLEVDTPLLRPYASPDLHVVAPRLAGPKPRFLCASPEMEMKRLLAVVRRPIFQITKSFREGEEGQWHAPEFTLVEWYHLDSDSARLRQETRALVLRLAEEAASLGLSPPSALCHHTAWAEHSFEETWNAAGLPQLSTLHDSEVDAHWAFDVQPHLGKPRPLFVTPWPSRLAGLARCSAPGTADRFEAFFAGLELCNGFAENTDAALQRERWLAAFGSSAPSVMDESYLAALAELPPCAGNALGLDRVFALLAGAPSLSAVLPFAPPADR